MESQNTTESIEDRQSYVPPTLTNLGTVEELTQGAVNVGPDIGIYS